MSSDLLPTKRRRLRDRRPAPASNGGWWSTTLFLPGSLTLPDGVDYGPWLATFHSRGIVPDVVPGPVPRWLRKGWAGIAMSVFALAVIGTVIVLARDEAALGAATSWLFGVGGPIVSLFIAHSAFGAWWRRAETVRWLHDEAGNRNCVTLARSEAAQMWHQAVTVILRVRDAAGNERAHGMQPLLQQLYPHVCHMHELAGVGMDSLNSMPTQKAEYDQVKADAQTVVDAILADADTILRLAGQTGDRLGWRPAGGALPEPELVKVDELR